MNGDKENKKTVDNNLKTVKEVLSNDDDGLPALLVHVLDLLRNCLLVGCWQCHDGLLMVSGWPCLDNLLL